MELRKKKQADAGAQLSHVLPKVVKSSLSIMKLSTTAQKTHSKSPSSTWSQRLMLDTPIYCPGLSMKQIRAFVIAPMRSVKQANLWRKVHLTDV
jgi:hypothetical protein